MALETLSDISSVLVEQMDSQLARQWNRPAVLASRLQAKAGAGPNCVFSASFDGAVAGSRAEGADMQDSEFDTDALAKANLSWGHYSAGFKLSLTALDAAMSARGSASAIVDLFGERVLGSVAKLANVINNDCYSGDGTDGSSNPNIVGLLGGALDTSGIYAGINRSSQDEWKGNELANGGIARPLTLDLLEHGDQLRFQRGGARGNEMVVMDSGSFRKYKGLFEPIRRIEGSAPGAFDASVPEDRVFWQGMPVVRDKSLDGTNGTIIMGSFENVALQYLPHQGSEDPSVQLAGSNGAGVLNVAGIPVLLLKLARTGDAVKFQMLVRIQLVSKRPKDLVVIKDLAV